MGKRIRDIRWLSVWCRRFTVSEYEFLFKSEKNRLLSKRSNFFCPRDGIVFAERAISHATPSAVPLGDVFPSLRSAAKRGINQKVQISILFHLMRNKYGRQPHHPLIYNRPCHHKWNQFTMTDTTGAMDRSGLIRTSEGTTVSP